MDKLYIVSCRDYDCYGCWVVGCFPTKETLIMFMNEKFSIYKQNYPDKYKNEYDKSCFYSYYVVNEVVLGKEYETEDAISYNDWIDLKT